MSVTFRTRIVSVQVKSKVIKMKDAESGHVFEETVPVGRLTLEFDEVDTVQAVAAMIGDRPVILGLADTQMGLRGLDGGTNV